MPSLPPKLSENDIVFAANKINVPVAALKAVIAVECRGRGFEGDRPIILFERHVFYRNLPKQKRPIAVRQKLATKNWRRGYLKSQTARYGRLNKAMKIDVEAALKACSYGIGQVLGENHKMCSFADVGRFVDYQFQSEAAQLDTMCRFIVARKLDRNMRNLDWSGFAYGYNGKSYKKHNYHIKLASAFKKADGTGRPSQHVRQYTIRFGAVGEHVKIVQNHLKKLGYKIDVDGVFGRGTALAVKAFQEDHGLKVDALVGGKTKAAIKQALKNGGK